jgi:carbonic anhydrase
VGDGAFDPGEAITMVTAVEALGRLRDGNRRFVANASIVAAGRRDARRAALLESQQPFAIILGCSDSRVPAEMVFDQGFGDLFVIRVAGNIVAPSQVGSVEFAAARFGTRLVVVMGHTNCGAIQATFEDMVGRGGGHSRGLASIVDRVRPAVESLLAGRHPDDPETVLHAAVRANVRFAATHLREGSDLLRGMIQREGLMIVGAEYSLETGDVEFFDGAP